MYKPQIISHPHYLLGFVIRISCNLFIPTRGRRVCRIVLPLPHEVLNWAKTVTEIFADMMTEQILLSFCDGVVKVWPVHSGYWKNVKKKINLRNRINASLHFQGGILEIILVSWFTSFRCTGKGYWAKFFPGSAFLTESRPCDLVTCQMLHIKNKTMLDCVQLIENSTPFRSACAFSHTVTKMRWTWLSR